jgi:hypothetical protein
MLTIKCVCRSCYDRTAAIQTLPLEKLWQSDVSNQTSEVSDQGSDFRVQVFLNWTLNVGRLLQDSPALCAFATLREKLLYLFRAGGLTLRRQAAKLSGPNEE